MNQEQMKKDLGPGAIFSIGHENTAFAQYFSGECYLNMLTTERVPIGNVTFAPGCRNNWHIHHKGGHDPFGNRWQRILSRMGTARQRTSDRRYRKYSA